MCMNSTKRILLYLIFAKFQVANLNLDDDFVPFFLSFFQKCKGRKYFFRIGKPQFLPWLLLYMEETCQPWYSF